MSIDPNNLGATAHQTFDDEFNSLNLWNGQSGAWATTFLFADPAGNGSSLPSNGEQEWYVNSQYAPTAGVQPWAVADGVLTLTAQPTDPAISGMIGYAHGEGPGLGSYAYTSGLITSAHSFSQTYGYFEMSAKLPAGDGLWPAFWLLPTNGAWPPELDAMEVLGKDPSTLYTSIHTAQSGSHTSDGVASVVADTSGGFHTYGIDWEADKVTWYFDGHKVFQTDTPADMHSPMYMLANLAIGGPWAGSADASTPLPAHMQIDYIRAYSALPDGGTDATGTGTGTPTGGQVSPPADGGPHTPQTVIGGEANEITFGGSANDEIYASGGADTVNGLEGDDTVSGGEGDDSLYGGKGQDILNGDAGNDLLQGNMGEDTLIGSSGDDSLLGGQGDDVLIGGDGADWLSGDKGADTMTGGLGADVFHFSQGSGADVITDFNPWEGDRLQLDAGMTWSAHQDGANVVVDFDGGEVVLNNVDMSNLHEGWVSVG